jgi:hypothetical protein
MQMTSPSPTLALEGGKFEEVVHLELAAGTYMRG